jgi:hypothetical protein
MVEEYVKLWNPEDTEMILESLQKHHKQQQKTRKKAKQDKRWHQTHYQDIQYRLARNLRIRVYYALHGRLKTGSAIKDLGCSIEFLREYIESKFRPGMNWKNWGRKEGQWSIDHILPLSSFDLKNPEEFKKACYYTNLQPMWHIENMKKGNKISFQNRNSLHKK